jgi:Tfp pilus assembly protein PilN
VGAAASARLIGAIHAAARDAGWTIVSISPAEAAWAVAAAALWPAAARDRAAFVVALDDRTDLVQLDEGRLAGVRHFRAGAADAQLVADAIRAAANTNGTARIATAGPDAPRRDLGRALSSRAITLSAPAADWVAVAESADLLAAAFAGPEAVPVLVSEDTRAARAERARRATRMTLVVAALLLALSAAFELWGVRRELSAAQSQRAALRPVIASTLVGRTTVETAFRQLATLGAADRSAPRWSTILAGVSEHLPEDAYLTAFRGRADSVVVDGLAAHAARVFDAIEQTPGLTAVRAAAPVRREAPSGSEAMEHFTIAAQLRTHADATPAKRAP